MLPVEKSEDIVILGAGPAGISTALFLAKAGIPSTILEKAVFPRDKICGDALSGKVVEVMKKLNPEWVDDLATQPQHLGSVFSSPQQLFRSGHRHRFYPGEKLPFQEW